MTTQLLESPKDRILDKIQQEVEANYEEMGIETIEDLKHVSPEAMLYIRF